MLNPQKLIEALASGGSLSIPKIKIEAEINHRFKIGVEDIPFLGTIEVAQLIITGPTDKDRDGLPEFMVDLDLGGEDVFHEDVELDPQLLQAAVDGAGDATAGLLATVFDQLKTKGAPLPF
jgi:hypothetical protein